MAINFDGVDDYIDFGSGTTLDNLDPWSLSFWFYSDVFPGTNAYEAICLKNATGFEVYNAYIDTDASGNTAIWCTVGFDASSAYAGSAYAPFAQDTWNHIVTIFDSTLTNHMQIFINGVETTYNAGGGPAAGVGTRVDDASASYNAARDIAAAGKELDGFLEDIRVYNRRLLAAEIQTIYTCRGVDGIKANLRAQWWMDEGAPGATASGASAQKDLSGNANHGTTTGSPTYVAGVLRPRRRVG